MCVRCSSEKKSMQIPGEPTAARVHMTNELLHCIFDYDMHKVLTFIGFLIRHFFFLSLSHFLKHSVEEKNYNVHIQNVVCNMIFVCRCKWLEQSVDRDMARRCNCGSPYHPHTQQIVWIHANKPNRKNKMQRTKKWINEMIRRLRQANKRCCFRMKSAKEASKMLWLVHFMINTNPVDWNHGG